MATGTAGPLNLPNAVTVLRFLLLAPVCWLLLAPDPTGGTQSSVFWAIAPAVLLAVWAATDWADGFLARRLDQVSRLGQILDPVADRVGIAVVLVVLAITDLLPWWLIVVVIVVDLGATLLAGPAARRGEIGVSPLGKVRTAVMLSALVGLVLGSGLAAVDDQVGGIVLTVSRGVLLAGAVLHVIAGVDYVRRAHRSRPDQSIPAPSHQR